MSSWAGRRKLIYGGTTAVIVLAASGLIVFKSFYKAPSCSDGIKNGGEAGTDCGGSCERLCQNYFLSPNVAWTSYEQVGPGLYNLAAYIINPNVSGEVAQVPFNMVVYDQQGLPIIFAPGNLHIPPGRNTLAFVGPVSLGKRIPYKVLFEFTAAPNWVKSHDTLASLIVGDKNYTEDEGGSSLLVSLRDAGVAPIGGMTVYTVLSDKDSNVIGFSKTKVDGIAGQGTADAPFTWPYNRQGRVVSIEVLPVAE
jgi:hypothetical protein